MYRIVFTMYRNYNLAPPPQIYNISCVLVSIMSTSYRYNSKTICQNLKFLNIPENNCYYQM